MLIRCEFCEAVIGEKVEDGLLIRKENHKEVFIENVIKVTCENNHVNYLFEKKEEPCLSN